MFVTLYITVDKIELCKNHMAHKWSEQLFCYLGGSDKLLVTRREWQSPVFMCSIQHNANLPEFTIFTNFIKSMVMTMIRILTYRIFCTTDSWNTEKLIQECIKFYHRVYLHEHNTLSFRKLDNVLTDTVVTW